MAMPESNDLDAILTRLESDDANSRDVAAAEIGDLMEVDYLKTRDYRKAVKRLIAASLKESDWSAKESMFNALSYASSSEKAAAIDWDPIAQALDNVDVACLEHALIILGDSGNPKYKARIRRYLDNPDETIATTAADALKTIHWKQQRGASQVQLKAKRNH
jgi:hypothetical protein